MRLIPRDSLIPTPWKNGGGVTRQIACWPDGSDIGTFDWRISTAEVAQDGPFSRFEGIDRRLYILEGAGLDLRFGAEAPRRLGPGEHIDFAGEDAVFGKLVEGPVTDLNIMVRRERQRMQVEAVSLHGARTLELPWETAAVFVLGGAVRVAGSAVAANGFDTFMLEAEERRLAASGQAELLLIGFDNRRRGA